MTLLNPLGLIFLALAPVLVVLYLRRARRREVAVPALFLWERALGDRRHRAFLGRLRQWASLLLHLLILALLVLALARPEWGRPGVAGEAVVLVVDTRARMQAVEPGGKARFALALEKARAVAGTASEGRPVALVAAGPEAEVLSPFSTDPARLLARLDALEPTDAGGDPAPALALARELVASRPGRVVFLTAGQGPGEPAERVEVGGGVALENVAITRFAARPELGSPQTASLLLEVANFGSAPAKGNVEIFAGETLLDVRPFDLAPGAFKRDVFPALPAMEAGRLTARLATGAADALAVDDVAYATLPRFRPVRVLLVSEGNWFLEKLLAAEDGVKFDLLAPAEFRPEMGASFDVVIYDRNGPASLSELRGNALFFRSGPFAAKGGLKAPLVGESEAGSPLLRRVEWRGITLLEAAQLPAPPKEEAGWRFGVPLQTLEGEPLIITGEHGRQRLAVFAFDLGQSDLPLHVAFPLLMTNTLRWLADREAAAEGAVPTGRTITLAPGESAAGQRGVLRPLKNGFYEITPAEGEPRTVAASTASEAESDLRQATPATPSGETALALPVAPGGQPLWFWFVAAALALLALEWWLFHRRETE